MQQIILKNAREFETCIYKVLDSFNIVSCSFEFKGGDIILNLPNNENIDESEFLNRLKENYLCVKKIELEKKINEKCDALILEGFDSNALGEIHHYDMRLEDQLNIQALASASLGSPFRCAKVLEDGKLANKTYKEHTAEQIKKVFADGLRFKSEILNTYGAIKERLYTINSLEELANFERQELAK
ncbi:hypothetical protein [Helicobacter cetorum]|uniref:DUF4376 domain-containing protein n=1 Tax=Helicobacter cetorum TaxID=138563 RepID=UPI000CF11353|nr:hypothetical protein [Helicobacter cetorum]